MATVVPDNTAIQFLFRTRNTKRLLELEEDDRKRERDDYRTINSERGPTRQ